MNTEDLIKISPPHPGSILLEEYLRPLNFTPHALAMGLHVPASRVDQIIKGKRGITAETAMRLGRYFGTSSQYWMNLQAYYDLSIAEDARASIVERELQPRGLVTG